MRFDSRSKSRPWSVAITSSPSTTARVGQRVAERLEDLGEVARERTARCGSRARRRRRRGTRCSGSRPTSVRSSQPSPVGSSRGELRQHRRDGRAHGQRHAATLTTRAHVSCAPCWKRGSWAALGQSALIVGALLVARFPRLTEPRMPRARHGVRRRHPHQRGHDRPRRPGVRGGRPRAGRRRSPRRRGRLLRAHRSGSTAAAEREDPEEPVEDAEDAAGDEALAGRGRRDRGPQPHASGWCSTGSPSRSRSG